jgi:hypothetical protein
LHRANAYNFTNEEAISLPDSWLAEACKIGLSGMIYHLLPFYHRRQTRGMFTTDTVRSTEYGVEGMVPVSFKEERYLMQVPVLAM